MNTYVAIITRVSEVRSDDRPFTDRPDDWPGDCMEFETLEDAQAAYPDKTIMTITDYLTTYT